MIWGLRDRDPLCKIDTASLSLSIYIYISLSLSLSLSLFSLSILHFYALPNCLSFILTHSISSSSTFSVSVRLFVFLCVGIFVSSRMSIWLSLPGAQEQFYNLRRLASVIAVVMSAMPPYLATRGVHPPEAMMHFPSVSNSPCFRKKIQTPWKISQIVLFHLCYP